MSQPFQFHSVPPPDPAMQAAVDRISQTVQTQIEAWIKMMTMTHFPNEYPEIIRLIEEQKFEEVHATITRLKACIVYDTRRPNWRGFEIDGKLVGELQSLTGDEHPDVWQSRLTLAGDFERVIPPNEPDPLPQSVIDELNHFVETSPEFHAQQRANYLADPAHIDRLIRGVDRDERRRRQREMGRIFVKYGITR